MPAVPRPAPRRRRPPRSRRGVPGRVRVLLVVLLALTAGVSTGAYVANAQAQLEAWGTTRRVPVAAREIAAGRRVQPDDIVWRDQPVALVPADVVATDPTGEVVSERVLRDEIVRVPRLGPAGVEGVAALVAPGWRGIAIPADARTPPLAPGYHVDLYAVDDSRSGPSTDPGAPGGSATSARRLSAGARVLDVTDRRITVAVPQDDAAGLSAALVTTSVIVAVTSG
jgi:Flp pilus assembly protein CpaB